MIALIFLTHSLTTTASFGVDFLVGAVDGASSEATQFSYQMGIGLETSFTGEDALSATIDIGNASGVVAGSTGLNFDNTTDALKLDGLHIHSNVGGATVMVGDNTDISAVYTGAVLTVPSLTTWVIVVQVIQLVY